MRSNFRKELKKIKDSIRSGADAEDVYVPSTWMYEELKFLADCETPDRSKSTVVVKKKHKRGKKNHNLLQSL